jgi:hypothetical protein
MEGSTDRLSWQEALALTCFIMLGVLRSVVEAATKRRSGLVGAAALVIVTVAATTGAFLLLRLQSPRAERSSVSKTVIRSAIPVGLVLSALFCAASKWPWLTIIVLLAGAVLALWLSRAGRRAGSEDKP